MCSFSLFSFKREKNQKERMRFQGKGISPVAMCDSRLCLEKPQTFEKV